MNNSIITIKNLKVAQFASEETLCFQATVYVDGAPFCVASNEGRGGPNRYDSVKRGDSYAPVNISAELAKRIDPKSVATHDEAKRANEEAGLTAEALGWEGWQKAYDEGRLVFQYDEIFDKAVDDAVHLAMVAKDLKRALGGKVLYTLHDKPGLFETKKVSKAVLTQWLADPAKLTAALKAKEVLNLLPFDEALKIYRKT